MGNFLVLVPFPAALLVGAIIVFLVRGIGELEISTLVGPSFATTLVMIWFVPCLAAFSDSFRVRGALPRVAYALFWFTSLMVCTASYFSHSSELWGFLLDYMGQRVIHDYLFQGGLSQAYTGMMHSSH